jgi:trehalose 6-phosphate phosphatase
VDGTLLDFASHPDAVVVGEPLVALLQGLHRASAGSLALVSGRSIASLDRLFAPFRGVAVGLHGLEIRVDPLAEPARVRFEPVPPGLYAAVASIAAPPRGSLIEDKGVAIAVHHRLAAPAMQALRRELLAACARLAPGWTVLRGRQVLELKPEHATKAHGVDALMVLPPFAGTLPLAFGDDITDLDMFEAIRRHAGTSVAVGRRIAGAGDLQVDTPDESVSLLVAIREALERGAKAPEIAILLRSHAHA